MSGKLDMDISIPFDGWTRSRFDAGGVCRLAAYAAWRLAAKKNDAAAEVSLVLADDETVRGLNRTYRDKDQATNVLSFSAREGSVPATPGDAPELLGDIVIAYETTAQEAKNESKPLADHLSHLVVHGMLHLLGFEHGSDTEASVMENLEIEILETLEIANPYLSAPEALDMKEAAG